MGPRDRKPRSLLRGGHEGWTQGAMEYELTVDLDAVTVSVTGEDREKVLSELLECIRFVEETDVAGTACSAGPGTSEATSPWAGGQASADGNPEALGPIARKTGLTRGTLAEAFAVPGESHAPPRLRPDDAAELLAEIGPGTASLIVLYLLEECYPEEVRTLPALREALEAQGLTAHGDPIEGNEYIELAQAEPPRVALTQAGRVQARDRLRAFVEATTTAEEPE